MTERASRLVNLDGLKEVLADRLPIAKAAEELCGVELAPAGRQLRGLCPFHSEDTPSFYVDEQKGVCHCFGCKRGGDAIAMVREAKHLGFVEALRFMAQAAEVDLSEYERPLTDAERELARLERGVEEWLGTLRASGQDRVPAEIAAEFGVGLTTRKPRDVALERVDDYLLEGVVFPYRTPDGRIAGWKTRERPGAQKRMYATPDDFPLNQPTLFGVQVARQHVADRGIILVEGEYDALAMHAAGYQNTVALGGSVLLDEHLGLLRDLSIRSVTLLLDGDEAGYRATRAIAEKYWDASEPVFRVVELPEGTDPESFIASDGPDMLGMLLGGARHALEWLLWREWSQRDRTSLTERLEFVSWIRERYGDRLRAPEWAVVLQEVARWLEIPYLDALDLDRTTGTEELHAIDSEKVILGRALRDRAYFIDLRRRLTKDDLFLTRNQRVWEVLERMLYDGLEFDAETLRLRAQAQGVTPEYVEALVGTGDVNLAWHEEQVLESSLRRRTRDSALEFRALISDPAVPAERAIGQLTSQVTAVALRHDADQERAISEQVDLAMETIQERMRNPTGVHGLSLGAQLPNLTRSLQGIQNRRVVLICAASSVGKTTFMLQMATNIAVHNAVPIDVISLEMDTDEILFKIASHMTGIDSMKISGGTLDDAEIRRVEKALLAVRNSTLRIHTPDSITPSEFVLYAREQRMRRRTEAFFIDYVQLTTPDAENARMAKHEWLGEFTKTAKQKVARAMDCAVICCAQLNRASMEKERPTKEDLGDSYQMARDADVLLILTSPADEMDVSAVVPLECWVDKNRQGIANVLLPMTYTKTTQTFVESGGGALVPEYLIPN